MEMFIFLLPALDIVRVFIIYIKSKAFFDWITDKLFFLTTNQTLLRNNCALCMIFRRDLNNNWNKIVDCLRCKCWKNVETMTKVMLNSQTRYRTETNCVALNVLSIDWSFKIIIMECRRATNNNNNTMLLEYNWYCPACCATKYQISNQSVNWLICMIFCCVWLHFHCFTWIWCNFFFILVYRWIPMKI